jgi:hypothetical protein
MDTDDTASLSDDSGWSSSDDSDIEELLQDDDVEMVSLLIDVQEFERPQEADGSEKGVGDGASHHPPEPRSRPRAIDARLLRGGTDIPTTPLPEKVPNAP